MFRTCTSPWPWEEPSRQYIEEAGEGPDCIIRNGTAGWCGPRTAAGPRSDKAWCVVGADTVRLASGLCQHATRRSYSLRPLLLKPASSVNLERASLNQLAAIT